MECEWIKAFAFSGVLSVCLGSAWIAAYFLSGAWARAWAWIDDAKPPKKNPLIAWSMGAMGWSDGDWLWAYKKGKKESDGERGFFFPFLGLLVTPPLIVLAIALFPLTLAMVTLYLLARLARFARRHKKLFDKHVADPEAHK